MNSSRVAACALRNEHAVRAHRPGRPVLKLGIRASCYQQLTVRTYVTKQITRPDPLVEHQWKMDTRFSARYVRQKNTTWKT